MIMFGLVFIIGSCVDEDPSGMFIEFEYRGTLHLFDAFVPFGSIVPSVL